MDKKLVLGSKSPRRQQLVKELGFPVEVRLKEVEEIYPDSLSAEEVPEYLSKLKSTPLVPGLKDNEILITSDTVVVHDNKALGKPKDTNDARQMLSGLSGKVHQVITGVCLTSNEKQITFSTTTEVHFAEFTIDEIDFYIDRYKPFDKAGSYGIQEWIGYIGVQRINGCYYNVVGLPVHDLYQTLKREFLQ